MKTLTRTCVQCDTPLPADSSPRRLYCHANCCRVAGYQRKSPEARFAINKRSNDRRFAKDLLPHIRSLSRDTGIPSGHPIGVLVVKLILIERHRKWRLNLALNYVAVREALADLAGGHEALEQLEDEIFEQLNPEPQATTKEIAA